MPWLRTYIKRCGLILGVALLLLIILVASVDLGLSTDGMVALILGALLTIALTLVLMGLVFFSNRGGQDRNVHESTSRKIGDKRDD